jgi:hypothetical protein
MFAKIIKDLTIKVWAIRAARPKKKQSWETSEFEVPITLELRCVLTLDALIPCIRVPTANFCINPYSQLIGIPWHGEFISTQYTLNCNSIYF